MLTCHPIDEKMRERSEKGDEIHYRHKTVYREGMNKQGCFSQEKRKLSENMMNM